MILVAEVGPIFEKFYFKILLTSLSIGATIKLYFVYCSGFRFIPKNRVNPFPDILDITRVIF